MSLHGTGSPCSRESYTIYFRTNATLSSLRANKKRGDKKTNSSGKTPTSRQKQTITASARHRYSVLCVRGEKKIQMEAYRVSRSHEPTHPASIGAPESTYIEAKATASLSKTPPCLRGETKTTDGGLSRYSRLHQSVGPAGIYTQYHYCTSCTYSVGEQRNAMATVKATKTKTERSRKPKQRKQDQITEKGNNQRTRGTAQGDRTPFTREQR